MTITNKFSYLFLRDVISLYGVAAANLLLPIIFIPYASTKIGVDGFGSFAVLAALFQYGNMIVEFGTTSPLVKSLSSNNSTSIFWGVVIFRLSLCFLSVIVITLIIKFIYNSVDVLSILIGFFSLIGTALNPVALYQSKGKLPIYSLIVFISRLFISICSMIMIESHREIWVISFFQFFPIFLASFLSLYFIFNKENIRFCLIGGFFSDRQVFGESISFFIGTVFSSGYTVAIPIIINHFFGGSAAGIYGVIDRVVQPIKQIVMPLINILYPKICLLFSNNKKKAVSLSIKSTLLICFFILVFMVMSYFLLGYIKIFVFKNIVPEAYLYPMMFNVSFVYISQLLVFFFVVPLEKAKTLKIVYMIMLILFIIMTFFSVWIHSLILIYWSLAAIELCGVIFLFSISFFTARKILMKYEKFNFS